MNEADPSPINLDELRLLPDWLREEGPPPAKQYASHAGGDADDSSSRRGSRPGGFNRDNRGFGGVGGPGGNRRPEGGRRSGPPPRGGLGRPPREERRPEPVQFVAPAPVRVEFLPDDKCLASITKQIRSTHMAYPLFGLARMFLQEPERHWVQFSLVPGTGPAAAALYQLDENGPVTLDRAVLERIAFDTLKDRYYTEQTEQKDPPKGNFTNVARNRLNGALLGPTNYHGYQPALRTEYETRFSRRMSFEDYRRNIEVVNDPVLVERWKEDARTTITIATRAGEPPTVLQSEAEARAHFRQHYFDGLLRTGTTFKAHGSVARDLPEPAMMQAIRQAHDTELRYPAQFVQLLRQGLQNAGLHIFKHRKRVVYVSLARPTPFTAGGAVSENVAAILETVAQFPLCTRKLLADQVLARKFDPKAKQIVPTKPVPSDEPSAEPSASAPDSSAITALEVSDAPAVQNETAAQAVSSIDTTPEATASLSDGASTESAVPAAPETVGAGEASAPAATELGAQTDDPLTKAKAMLAADLRFLVQAGHLIEFHNGTFDLPLPPRPKEEPRAATPASRQGVPPRGGMVKTTITDAPGETETDDAEREALTVESVTILTPDASSEAELPPTLESGMEQTEAQIISEPGHMDRPGISSTDPHEISPDAVVIGDAESAHPLSPL